MIPEILPFKSTRWWFAAAIGALTGFLAVYYAFLFWQFLGFAIIAQVLRRNTSKLKSVLSITVISITCTVAMAIPHELYRILHGPNTSVVQRTLVGLELYGLKLPELFLPPAHRWKAFAEFAQANYYEPAMIRGEMGSPYLGLVGVVGLVWLAGLGVARMLKGNGRAIPVMFWQSLWIIVFSLIGGVNLLLGAAGLQLFRATNRYSILLLCLALLFLAKMLGRICPPAYRSAAALGLLLVGLWDVLPPFVDNQGLQAAEKIVTEDRNFVQRLEQKVPPGTMVFQLPVMDFPEVPPRLGVLDYSQFRPYLHSGNLRFSYGSNKGRALESWQRDMEILPAKVMSEKLESFGFGVILINRAGFSDSAESLLRDLDSSGRKVIEQDGHGEFVAIGLRRSDQPVLPEIPPFPGPGFYGWEGDWQKSARAWSKGNATLILTNLGTKPIEKQYTLSLNSLSKRRVTVFAPKENKTIELNPGQPVTVALLPLRLAPGETHIQFETDTPAMSPGPAEQRKVAFSVALVSERPKDPLPVLGPGFYGWEGDWRKGAHSWSQGPATLTLTNPAAQAMEKRYSFTLSSISKRRVTIITPSETKTVELAPGKFVTIGPFTIQLQPGETPIRFETDKPGVPAGAGDTRKMTFSIAIAPQTEGPAN